MINSNTDEHIDMHIHTNCSNGEKDIIYILQDAEKNGIKVISIADFNTLAAYFQLQNINISDYYTGEIVIGCEVNCKFDDYCSDMIAYNIKDIAKMQDWLVKNTGKDNSEEAQKEQLEYYKNIARKLGLIFDENLQIGQISRWAGVTIATEITKYKENEDKIENFEEIKKDTALFWIKHSINIKSPFHFDITQYRPKLESFIKIVHECGGLVFCAHPFAYVNTEEELKQYLKICLENGVDGIECYQCYNQDIEFATKVPLEFCKEKGIYPSGGTDFHSTHDSRYSGIGILGSETIKNYSSFIPLELVKEWIQPQKFQREEAREDNSER